MTAMAVLFALVLAAAATASSAGNTSVETLDRTPNGGYLKRPWPKGEPSFFYNFAGATSLADDFWSSGPWANGQPFTNGWDPGYLFFSSDGGLTLKLERKPFSDPGTSTGTGKRYDFTGGEVRSKDFYGYGTYRWVAAQRTFPPSPCPSGQVQIDTLTLGPLPGRRQHLHASGQGVRHLRLLLHLQWAVRHARRRREVVQ
jgi:hypothetical protein